MLFNTIGQTPYASTEAVPRHDHATGFEQDSETLSEAPGHRTKRTKGCLTCRGMLHMMFELAECAQKNWRWMRGFGFLAPVITGVRFVDGVQAINEPKRKAT